MTRSKPEPRAVAITDQWRAGLRELVNRVRYHRIGCPDEGAGVICIGAGTLNDIEAMSRERVQALLITALYEMAGYPLAQNAQQEVNDVGCTTGGQRCWVSATPSPRWAAG